MWGFMEEKLVNFDSSWFVTSNRNMSTDCTRRIKLKFNVRVTLKLK